MTQWEIICKEFDQIRSSCNDVQEESTACAINVTSVEPEEEVTTDVEKCSNSKYIRHYVMPLVREALVQMINEAKREDVFKYPKRNRFNGCDFLTEYLYNNHSKRKGESLKSISDIPFCQVWDKNHPRPMLPLSLRYRNNDIHKFRFNAHLD